MPPAKLHIIGAGPGTNDYLLPIAKRKIEEADTLIGSSRLLNLFSGLKKEKITLNGNFSQAVSYIKKYKSKRKIVVLVSGDPGIHSFSEKLSRELGKNNFTVVPGISTMQIAFARIAETWQDAKIVSLHGRKTRNLAQEIKLHNKVFLFTDENFPPHKIAKCLLSAGIENRRAVVSENLSYPDEKILDTDLAHLSKERKFGLCALIIESQTPKLPNSKTPKLYGVGIGPGDPKLLTLRAKEILDRVDIIFVPKGNEDTSSWARAIVESVVGSPKKFIELTFPMTMNKTILNKYWLKASRIIAGQIKKGKEVAFVTIGDPFIYSTYIYLLKTLKDNFPGIEVETVPGISAFSAASSRLNFSLAQGYEKFAVVPVTKDLRGLRETLLEFDTVALMKVGSKLERIVSLLKELGLVKNAVLISRVGHKDEKIVRNLSALRDKKAGYLSVILVRKK